MCVRCAFLLGRNLFRCVARHFQRCLCGGPVFILVRASRRLFFTGLRLVLGQLQEHILQACCFGVHAQHGQARARQSRRCGP